MSQRSPYHRPKPPPPADPVVEIAALVEANRDRVRELEARGFLPSQICAVTKLPATVVTHILTSKAPPKRGPK